MTSALYALCAAILAAAVVIPPVPIPQPMDAQMYTPPAHTARDYYPPMPDSSSEGTTP
jgi:hypothetical protein